MNTAYRRLQRLACLLALLCCGQVNAMEPPVAPLVLEVGEWMPYIDFSLPAHGPLSQLTSEAFAKSGRSVTLRETSWKTAEVHIDSNEIASFGWVKNSERLKRWRYSDPICSIRTMLVLRKDNPVLWRSFDELKGRKIGWSRGYSYGEKFDQMKPAFDVLEMPTDEVGLKRLLAGSIDAMPMDYLVARQLIERRLSADEAGRLVIDTDSSRVVSQTDVHFVCAIKSVHCADLIRQFNQGLREIRTGTQVPSCGAN